MRHRETEDIKKDVIKNAMRIAEEEAAAAEKAKEEEHAARAARKLALNTAWMNKSPLPCKNSPYLALYGLIAP